MQGLPDHILLDLVLGLLWDTRDHEFVPRDGTFTELSVRASPGVAEDLRFVGFHVSTSWFASVAQDWLVLGARFMTDVLVGDPPIYELVRFGRLRPEDGAGGGRSLRVVRLQRFHGRIKAPLNLELRTQFPAYELSGTLHRAGITFFADTGRVFSDWSALEQDGQSVDAPVGVFQLGLGAGLRYQWGEILIIRADVGYSPTDETSGVYIDVGQVF